jgi:NAD(P)-dependent dehydrogenase (short-subunit alcohol dehydrogenase family)
LEQSEIVNLTSKITSSWYKINELVIFVRLPLSGHFYIFAHSKKMRTAIVVGGNRGLGLECVKLLLEEKSVDKVIATARKPENFPNLGNEKIRIEPLDIASPSSVENFACTLGEKSFDILVLNAGVAPELEKKGFESIKTTINVNYFGMSCALKALFPLAREGARIVSVSSVFGLRGMLSLNPNPNVFEGNYVFDYGQKLFS